MSRVATIVVMLKVINMKFPGFIVSNQSDEVVVIKRVDLDDTELTPESNWMEGYPNKDLQSGVWLGRDLESALLEIRRRMVG